MKSYINVIQVGNKIYHTYIEDGIKKKETVDYQPIYGYMTSKESEWKDVYGNNLETIRFPDIRSANAWKKEQTNILNVYGDISKISGFITENYPHDVIPQIESMCIMNFDLECNVGAAGGFPKATDPENYINAITFQDMNKNYYYVYSLKDYTPTEPNVTYKKCKDERDLLEHIIDFLMVKNVDILVGFNIDVFDIPYIVDRITLVMGEDKVKRLSPLSKIIRSEKVTNKKHNRISITYSIQGILILDYIELYKKFVFDGRESYSLDYISKYELGEGKIEYKDKHGNLNTLYDDDFDKFIQYNIHDTTLVYKLNKKLKFIEVAIGYAYSMKCNIDEINGTLRPWDGLLYSVLYNKKILVGPNKTSQPEEYLGGYVKDPARGFQKWVTVDDIVSSYPNNLIQSNISTETILSNNEVFQNKELSEIKEKFTGVEKCIDQSELGSIQPILDKYDVTFTCNGQFFKRDKQGFIPEIVESIFNSRKEIKNQLKNKKDEKERLLKLLPKM